MEKLTVPVIVECSRGVEDDFIMQVPFCDVVCIVLSLQGVLEGVGAGGQAVGTWGLRAGGQRVAGARAVSSGVEAVGRDPAAEHGQSLRTGYLLRDADSMRFCMVPSRYLQAPGRSPEPTEGPAREWTLM